MVGCSAVGEPGCEGLPLGLKKEGVLEGRVAGALKARKKNRTIRIVVEESGLGRNKPAPTWEELWKRIVPTEWWMNSHRPMDVGNDGEKRKGTNLEDLE